MKNLFVVCISVVLLVYQSCKKEEKPPKEIPVSYFLSENDKALFNFYRKGLPVKYIDQDNNEITFVADTFYDIKTHKPDDLNFGEQYSIPYKNTSNYLSDFFIYYVLISLQNNKCKLLISFGNNTNDIQRLSTFYLDPNDTNKIGYTLNGQDTLYYEKLDSIVLHNRKFYNIYYLKNSTQQGSEYPLTFFSYYSKTKGIIAFKNEDNKFWVLKDE